LGESDKHMCGIVNKAYEPILKNSTTFDAAVKYILDWNDNHIMEALDKAKLLPAHSMLMLGLTDAKYKIHDRNSEHATRKFWEQYSMDVAFIPMNHFDCVESTMAMNICLKIKQMTS